MTFGVLAALAGHRDVHGQVLQRRQELVQRRVDQPYGHRQPVHLAEQVEEIGALQRFQRGQRHLTLGCAVGQDHPLQEHLSFAEEHVLGAAQADTLGAHPPGPLGVGRGVGVRPHPHPSDLVGVRQ